MTDRELVDVAFTMLERSYVPYSQFPVGAALLCADGTVFTGCNVENAAYGSTICAERVAAVKAVTYGRLNDWTTLAVAGSGGDYCWPCGACRQMLYEFCPELTILVARGDREYVKVSLAELLPHGFGAKTLEKGNGRLPEEEPVSSAEESALPVEEAVSPAEKPDPSEWERVFPKDDPVLQQFAKFFEDDWYTDGT